MKVFAELGEVAERLEELIEVALLGDEIMICRDGAPVARLSPFEEKEEPFDAFLRLAEEGHKNVAAGATSSHDDIYDKHGLPI